MRERVEVSDGDRWSGVLGDRKLKSEMREARNRCQNFSILLYLSVDIFS